MSISIESYPTKITLFLLLKGGAHWALDPGEVILKSQIGKFENWHKNKKFDV